jgi:hypothetical protein
MARKNPNNNPLRIVYKTGRRNNFRDSNFPLVLAQLAVAESNLVRAGKDSAMPHFIALVKAIEDWYDIEFQQVDVDTF